MSRRLWAAPVLLCGRPALAACGDMSRFQTAVAAATNADQAQPHGGADARPPSASMSAFSPPMAAPMTIRSWKP